MRKLNLNEIEEIHGGGDVSSFISGACVSIGLLGALKIITVSAPVGVALGVGCAVNFIAGDQGWW